MAQDPKEPEGVTVAHVLATLDWAVAYIESARNALEQLDSRQVLFAAEPAPETRAPPPTKPKAGCPAPPLYPKPPGPKPPDPKPKGPKPKGTGSPAGLEAPKPAVRTGKTASKRGSSS